MCQVEDGKEQKHFLGRRRFMKVFGRTFVALAVLASASMAQGAATVWYSSGPLGAPATELVLTCDTSGPAGTCTFPVTMNLLLTSTAGQSWATDLGTAASDVSISGPTIVANAYNANTNAGVPGTGQDLLVGSQGAAFGAGAPAGTYGLLTFNLSRSFVTGDLSTATIVARNGAFEFVSNDDYEIVQYGANPPISGEAGNVGGPVIRIVNVPEPTTLALLALGGLALIRRR
jgi:hypothetical protein